MTILICLCGVPLIPQLNAGAGRLTSQKVQCFVDDLKRADYQQTKVLEEATHVLRNASIERGELKALEPRLRMLECALGRRQARDDTAAGRRDARGRHWQAPSMAAARAASRAKTRAWLECELRQRMLTAREAEAVVTAILEAIKEALLRYEVVETPLGEFRLVGRTPPYERKRWGKTQTLHLHRIHVKYRPDPSLVWKEDDHPKRRIVDYGNPVSRF
jgi:hypothetical protein